MSDPEKPSDMTEATLRDRVVSLETLVRELKAEMTTQRDARHKLANALNSQIALVDVLEKDVGGIKVRLDKIDTSLRDLAKQVDEALVSIRARLGKVEGALLAKGAAVLILVEIVAGVIQHVSR